MIIEIDVDGVLNNLLIETLKAANIDTKIYDNILNYNLVENDCLSDGQVNKIYSIWEKTDIYLQCKPVRGIELIDKIANISNVKVVIHSLCINNNVVESKIKWLKRYIKSDKIVYNIDIGFKKVLKYNVDVIIEDNPEYILNSRANQKIIIDKPYNRCIDNALRFKDTYSALDYVYRGLLNGR